MAKGTKQNVVALAAQTGTPPAARCKLPAVRTTGRSVWLVAVVFALLTTASLAPIRSNDYFWHLATGRWIVEHRALPLTDPFALASSREPWIQGEWLFDSIVYPIYAGGGHAAVAWTLAMLTAAIFSCMFVLVADETGFLVALPIVITFWYAAEAWLRERPATAGAVCLAVLLALLVRGGGRFHIAAVFALTVFWMNVHPSALIAPAVVCLYELGDAFDRRSVLRLQRPWVIVASSAALFVNPYGWRGVLAPFRLAGVVGAFHNEEWAASLPGEFPLFYMLLAAVIALHLFTSRRDHARAFVLVLLALLAIRYCRNQGLFFVAAPLLVAGLLPPLPSPRLQRIAAVAAVAVFLAVLVNAHRSTGVDEGKFPVRSVERLRASGLSGNIYNTYGLGGYLIWTFYPGRFVVTDGRNELYLSFNREHERALRDGHAWRALIRRYDLRLAIFDYHRPPLQALDPRTGRYVRVPQFAIYFPRREWAMIARDRVAMVFARRNAFPPELLAKLELR